MKEMFREGEDMTEEAKMQINARVYGDPSVGIAGMAFAFDFPLDLLDGDEDDSLRGELRDRFSDMVWVLADECPKVWFADECPDCLGRLQEDGFCHNTSCVNYLREGDEQTSWLA